MGLTTFLAPSAVILGVVCVPPPLKYLLRYYRMEAHENVTNFEKQVEHKLINCKFHSLFCCQSSGLAKKKIKQNIFLNSVKLNN